MSHLNIDISFLDPTCIHLGILLQKYTEDDNDDYPIPYVGTSLSIGFLFGSLHFHFVKKEVNSEND